MTTANLAETDVRRQLDLGGKVAVVTGATGYLGAAIAEALAEAGASVVATSRREADAAKVAASLPCQTAGHHGIGLDQLDETSLRQGFEAAIERTGHVDVLINNAHEPLGDDWTSVTAEAFDRQLRNATGYFLLARLLRDHAVSRGAPASVVLLGSMYGLVGSYPDAYADLGPASPVAYHVLKGGVIQMARHLGVYWAADRVRVNCLSPGAFPSPKADPELVERLSAKAPMGRIGRPEELKGPAVFLASDASSYMTGQNLVIDGGWTAW